MSKSLVIVESPNKVQTINKFLGKDFIVASSVGHIRDLESPKEEKKTTTKSKKTKQTPFEKLDQQVYKMGINPQTWEGNFQVMDEKIKIVRDLQKLAKECDIIYLATDLDREGEAIAWHLQEVLGSKKEFKRVIFNEITRTAVTEAFKNPTKVNMDRVHAQQTRRYLDRMVGFLVTHILWSKAGKGLSAGRVQSVATRMIVEREREIRVFIPIEYWKITGNSGSFLFDLISIDGKRLTTPEEKNAFYIANEEVCKQMLHALATGKALVKNIEIKESSVSPKAPFTTSTLQQSASTNLGFNIRRTMMIAQKLYESGFITYMRTDSTALSSHAVEMAKNYIQSTYGNEYLHQNRVYASRNSNAQEAHEAIRPTNLEPFTLANPDDIKLFNLIKNQFIASQMEDAKYLNTAITVEVEVEGKIFILKTSSRLLKFAGYQAAFGQKADELFDQSHGLKVGDELKIVYNSKQNFTQPPARYTEASLVKELEKRSIGRPSTYVSIITTIQERGYVNLDNKRFYATKIAEIVNDRLEKSFNNILDYNFTAQMEDELDQIATGEKKWTDEMTQFWSEFKQQVEKASLNEEDGGMPIKKPIPTDLVCTQCHKHKMQIQTSKQGDFLTCSAYSLKKEEKCKNTLSLINASVVLGEDYKPTTERCSKCNSGLIEYFIDLHTKLYLCTNASRCDYNKIEKGDFIHNQDILQVDCDKCNSPMVATVGPFGKYMLCKSCGNTRGILSNGELAPIKSKAIEFPELKCEKSKNAYFVLRNSSRGYFLGANTFPRCREIKQVEVNILDQYRDRLPEEILYLANGPKVDNCGNPTVLRFSVKENVQYIGSVNSQGKFTKYRADYKDGIWVDNAQELKEKEVKASQTTKISKSTSKTKTKNS